jgi:NAD(P)H-hydrate repair Nnr-like enzyme with NAD(P)H-hydrate dehydratase domain
VAPEAVVVLDAGAIGALAQAPDLLTGRGGRAVLTANPGELAAALGEEDGEGGIDAAGRVRRAAARFGAAVACGRCTGDRTVVFHDQAGGPGLGTSGSGDVRAGIVAGLAARGATPLSAALWGAHLHARAGDRLAARIGPVGFVARELLSEVPRELAELTARVARRPRAPAAAR